MIFPLFEKVFFFIYLVDVILLSSIESLFQTKIT